MIGLDTNILLRLWLDDDPAQNPRIDQFWPSTVGRRDRCRSGCSDRLTTQGTGLDVSTRTMEAVRRAETLSGRPIRLLEDASLQVIATLSMARDGATEHVLRYQPRVGPIDYFVLYQIGFLNRLFRCPAADRMDLIPTSTAAEQITTLVSAGLAPGAEDARHAYSFSATVAQWALVTLRSHPTGMRIDQWIHDEFPELRDLQARGMADMQQMNTGALTHRMGALRVPSTASSRPH